MKVWTPSNAGPTRAESAHDCKLTSCPCNAASGADRLADALERIAGALERIADTRPPRPALLDALRDAFDGSPFTASEAMALAETQAAEAAALGQAPAGLAALLDAEGIRSPHALGRRLAKLGAHRVCREGGGTLWQV